MIIRCGMLVGFEGDWLGVVLWLIGAWLGVVLWLVDAWLGVFGALEIARRPRGASRAEPAPTFVSGQFCL